MTTIETIDSARNLLNESLDTARTFPDNTSSFWTDAVLLNYFNIVQQEVAAEIVQTFEDFFITQTTISISAGVAAYSLPADFLKMRRVEDIRNSNPIVIEPMGLNEKDATRIFALGSPQSVGQGYYIAGTSIIFDATPTYSQPDSMKLHYTKRLADSTAASSISEIPVEWHRVMVWGIVKMALFQQQSDNSLASAEYEKLITRMKSQAEDRQTQKPRSVKRTFRNYYRRSIL